MRTHSISATHLTSLSDEHQEALADQEALMTPMGDQTTQEQYPPLILFLYNPQETLNLQGYPPSSSTVTEHAPMPSSGSYEST